ELVEADAPQRTEVLQRRCHIEREQQIDRGFEIEASELVWPLALPHFAGGGIPPRPDHGNNVLWNSVNIKKARRRPPRTRALIAIEADFCNDRVWSFEIRLGGERHAPCARLAAWCRSGGRDRRRRRAGAGRQVAAGPQAAATPGVSAAARLAAQSRIGWRRTDPHHHRPAAAEPDAADDPAGAGISAVDPAALTQLGTRRSSRACRCGVILLHRPERNARRPLMNRVASLRVAAAFGLLGAAVASTALAEPAPPFV